MGNSCQPYRSRTALVRLHVYDFRGKDHEAPNTREFLHAFGAGAYHVGIEVFEQEWSYGPGDEDGEGGGVFSRAPRCGDGPHEYREEVRLGRTELTQRQVEQTLERLKKEWTGSKYDLLRCNSAHFAAAFALELGVEQVPAWVTKLSVVGVALDEAGRTVAKDVTVVAQKIKHRGCDVPASTIMDTLGTKLSEVSGAVSQSIASTAAEVDERYQLRSSAAAGGQMFIDKAGELDERYGVSASAAGVAAMVKERAGEVWAPPACATRPRVEVIRPGAPAEGPRVEIPRR